MAVVALISLVLVIVIGTWKKVNIGIMGIIGACILAVIAQIPAKQVAAGFGSLLFLRLLSIQLLICVAQANGTMEVLAKKMIKVGCGKSIKLLPVILFFAFMACNTAGMDTMFLVTPVLVSLAFELGMSPLKVMFPLLLAFHGGSQSPLYATGANMMSLAEKASIDMGNSFNVVAQTWLTTTIMFFIFYFAFGWHKEKSRVVSNFTAPQFDTKQKITLVGFCAFVVATLFFNIDTLIAPAIIAFALMMSNAADPRQVVAKLPWNILIMIGGMSVLAGVIVNLGGVDLLAGIISKIAGPVTASPLMVGIAGIMSFFSSGNGVVMPTLIPTVPGIVAAGAAGQAASMVASITIGAVTSAISPISTIGANVMSCYGSIYDPSEEERTKFFNKSMLFTLCCLALQIVFALLGVYRLTILH